MAFVASFKYPLEIECVSLQCWQALEVLMRLTMKARQEVTKATAGQYRGASKKEKGKILDQFIATSGYSRWYARLVLRHEGRCVQTSKQTIVVVERKSRSSRKGARYYDEKSLLFHGGNVVQTLPLTSFAVVGCRTG